jgi:hypothetical protein
LSGLKEKLLAAISSAEAAVSDLKITVKYVRRAAPTHVPGASPTYAETLSDISLVLTRYESSEIDFDRILASDWRAIVFPGTGLVDFKVSDIIRVPATVGVVLAGDYRIMNDEKVMVGDRIALHQLQLRLT